MPIKSLNQPSYKASKESIVTWQSWRKGLNLLLRENEIDGSEAVNLTNLYLIGSGIPTKRWGSRDHFLSSPSEGNETNFILPIKDTDENKELLALSSSGFLVKKNGESYTPLDGASWVSTGEIDGVQLGNSAYIVSGSREWVKYDFSTLTAFPTLAQPTGLDATNISGVSGAYTVSWSITASGRSGGETTASDPFLLNNLPQDLTDTYVRLTWTPVSAASGDLTGYNIYRGDPGSESWIGGVASTVTSFDDFGNAQGNPFRTAPVVNTTGGPKAKYILRYQDRLILAGIPGDPTKILISGRYPDHERFDWYAGGGFIFIEPDSGENIRGLGIHQEKLVVFKENSVWQVSLNQVQFGQYLILDPQYKLLTASQGCTSHRSIVPVENDLMFSNRKGIYILRYEPQLLTVLNANEISAKIKPFFEGLSDEDLTSAAGAYLDKKYILSFPNSKKHIIFDRERLSFTGPWVTPYGITQWSSYVDDDGTDRWIAADKDDAFITEFNKNYEDDKGTAITTFFKSKKEDFGDWTVFKTINEVYSNFRALGGEVKVNIYVENRDGNVVTAKSFTISGFDSSGSSGVGIDQIGTVLIGTTSGDPGTVSDDEVTKRTYVYKQAKTFQIEIRTTGRTSRFELLGVKAIAQPMARGNSPYMWKT